jgi:hypothetical protein
MNKKQLISKVLFDADPMGTCCQENDLFDEYDDVAELIAEGLSVKDAFVKQFFEDCLTEEQERNILENLDDIV